MKWFDSLKNDEKKYIEDHRDPSHMVKYLKQGLSFIDSLKLGYLDYVNEESELYINQGKFIQIHGIHKSHKI